MSALERVAASLAIADKRGEPYVCATVELTRDDLREVIATVEKRDAELTALLDTIPNAVRVHEGGGPENLEASLAVSVAKLQSEVEDLVEKFQTALHAETERGNALAERVVELKAFNAELSAERNQAWKERDHFQAEMMRHRDAMLQAEGERDTLRAELAGAQAQAAAAKREVAVADSTLMHNECVLGDAGVDIDDGLDEAIVRVIRQRDETKAALAARDAEVPGLSKLPYYTPGDAKLIAETKGKPYARLAVTAELADLVLVLVNDESFRIAFPLTAAEVRRLAATGNETKEVES